MDQPTWVPPEKLIAQAARPRPPSSFSAETEFGPLGARHAGAVEWVPFSGAEAVSCREARGRLVQWLVDWGRRNFPSRQSAQWLAFEYEYPRGVPAVATLGPRPIAEGDGSPMAIGEADLATLRWLDRSRCNVSLQIDSDIICISLLFLLRTPESRWPAEWVWVASNENWCDEEVRAVVDPIGDFDTEVVRLPGAPAPTYCVDLVEMFRCIRRSSFFFPRVSDPDDRVRCFVLTSILGGCDYYTSKKFVSHVVPFDVMRRAVERGFVAHWKGGVSDAAFEHLCDWQGRLFLRDKDAYREVTLGDAGNDAAEEYDCSKLLRLWRRPTGEQLAQAAKELAFTLAYWSRAPSRPVSD